VTPGGELLPQARAVFAVLAATPSPILTIDEDERIAYATVPAAELFGYTVEELVGRPARVVAPDLHRSWTPAETGDGHGEDGPESADLLERLRARLDLVQGDVILQRRDGTLFPAEIVLTPLETEEARFVAARFEDLTERRDQERRLLELGRAYLSLVEVYQAIVRAPDEETLLSETCRIAVEHAGYLGAWVAEMGEDGGVRRLAAAGDLDPFLSRLDATIHTTRSEAYGPTARALREGRAVFSSEVRDDAATLELRRQAYEHGIRASATLPLRRDGRTVAVLVLYTARADLFDGEMRTLAEAVSKNVSLALERFAAADRLRAVAAKRRELSRRLVAAQEDERARIAADVHDDSVQSLAAVDLRLGLLLREVSGVAPELVPGVERAQATVSDVARGLRDLLFALEAADTDRPLADLLRDAADHVFEGTGVECTVSVDTSGYDGSSALSGTDRGQALRIVKEALFNARKHAQASQVRIEVALRGDGVEVVVADDGVGFDVDSVPTRPGHRGLANMRDRAEVSGGWCRVQQEEHGTTVRFWMPYAGDESV
jgi:PAS domain S-box-containing protein